MMLSHFRKLKALTKSEVKRKRSNMLKEFDGDCFFKIALWPKFIRRKFFSSPYGDCDTFDFVSVFFRKWMLTNVIFGVISVASHVKNPRWKKRIYQLDWLFKNEFFHRDKWFYFDIYETKYLYMNGNKRIKS
uniref:Uncharacterized protein n=1 Tax=Clytia hemisphaerica TaxID=252671 RepID=A0A7M5VEI2_9CNID